MDCTIGTCRLELIQGDITDQRVDAIVNAANSRLAGGGGVDGAIHRAGGPNLMEETKTKYPNGCPTGSAVVSSAGNLSARYVFHAVGPIWDGGGYGEAELLAGAYRSCLQLAIEYQCQSVAFPAISTGVYGYPIQSAAEVSLSTVIGFLRSENAPEHVRIVLFSNEVLETFTRIAEQLIR